jgi:Flp pilus assembly protein TadD
MKTYRGRAALAASVISGALLCLQSGVAHAQHVPAVADGTPQIDQEIAAGQLTAALHDLDLRVASNPTDVQAKFKRGTVLARLNRDDEAIAAFTALTQAYPEIPEPYNNLAALYAKHGDLGKARVTLETAVAANPAYAQGSQNLGTVYLRLALESFQQAARLDPRDTLSAQRIKSIDTALNLTPPAPVAAEASSAASAPTAYRAPTSPNGNLFTPGTMNQNNGH